ncbi:MAG: hypothetical protein M0C28_43615 [Candidatus Moduliflexus flocculans]|nr:hypothetical protein [Candidatus Moduliflexus flocculans]
MDRFLDPGSSRTKPCAPCSLWRVTGTNGNSPAGGRGRRRSREETAAAPWPCPLRSRAPGRLSGIVRLRAREPGDAGSGRGAPLRPSGGSPGREVSLAACAAAALALAFLSERLGRWYRPLLPAFAGAGIPAAGASGLPGAVLFRFPLPDHRGPYDLTATVETGEGPGFTVVTFRTFEAGATARGAALEVLGARTPPAGYAPERPARRGPPEVPRAPLVVRDPDGDYSLRFEGFALGWALR